MPKLLMFVPYSMRVLDSAPKVRAYSMYNALKREIHTTLISGGVYKRTLEEMKYTLKIRETDYAYIEAFASPLNMVDYRFLNGLRKKGVLIFPFVRDLYWKYPGTLEQNAWRSKWFAACEVEMNWYLKNATALLFPSKAMADTVDFPEKYELPPGGDASRCTHRKLPQKRNIVYVGGISRKAGVETLLAAMEYVLEECPDAYCTIVSNFQDPAIIGRWKYKKWLFLREGTYLDMRDIMLGAYLATIPWRTDLIHNNITIPLKLFDYMSFGRPVVATNCKVTTDFIRSNEVGVVTEDSPRGFAEGILRLLDDRYLAEKLGKNALLAIEEKHSWKDRAKELLAIIRKYI